MAITDGNKSSLTHHLAESVLIGGGWAVTMAVVLFDPGGAYGSVFVGGLGDASSEAMAQNRHWGEGTSIILVLVVILMTMAMIHALYTLRRDAMNIRTVLADRTVSLAAPVIAGVLAALILILANEAHHRLSHAVADVMMLALTMTTMAILLANVLRILRRFAADIRIFSMISVGLVALPWLLLLGKIKSSATLTVWALLWIPIAIVVIDSIRVSHSHVQGVGRVEDSIGFAFGVCVWFLGGVIDLYHAQDIYDSSDNKDLASFGFPDLAGSTLEVLGFISAGSATIALGILYVAGCRSRAAAWLSPMIVSGLYLLAASLWEPQMWWVER